MLKLGKNTIVEVDESLFVRRKNNNGRKVREQWCFGDICRQTRECFVVPNEDRSKNTLRVVIKYRTRPGTNYIPTFGRNMGRLRKWQLI